MYSIFIVSHKTNQLRACTLFIFDFVDCSVQYAQLGNVFEKNEHNRTIHPARNLEKIMLGICAEENNSVISDSQCFNPRTMQKILNEMNVCNYVDEGVWIDYQWCRRYNFILNTQVYSKCLQEIVLTQNGGYQKTLSLTKRLGTILRKKENQYVCHAISPTTSPFTSGPKILCCATHNVLRCI